jgi:dolichol-phosphate mannosyltransferase
MSQKVIVIIPTYNEIENVRLIIDAILTRYPEFYMLIVDDDSKDGTIEEVESLKKTFNRLFLISRRETVKGLGKSYIAGMQWALKNGMDKIVQMDADFSHDPAVIEALLRRSESADVVVGSRYISGTRVIDWPLWRLILSKAANDYIRCITRLPVSDCTSGFKCWNSRVLKAVNLDTIQSEGYIFQVEMTYRAHKNGFSVVEFPIVFTERKRGRSKIWKSGLCESAVTPWKLIFAKQGIINK